MNSKSMRAESQVCGEELLERRVLTSTNTVFSYPRFQYKYYGGLLDVSALEDRSGK